MTDTLFEIEPTRPKWQELADLHGICSKNYNHDFPLCSWEATIDHFGSLEAVWGQTEREAVITLIHVLKLEGWREVSI